MQPILAGINKDLIVQGGNIRVKEKKKPGNGRYGVGVAAILPNIQIALGEKFETFKKAVEISRAPIAFKEIPLAKNVICYKVIRTATGKIKEEDLANIITCNGIVIGVKYNTDIINSKEFRRYVKISALQLAIFGQEKNKSNLLMATKTLSAILKVPREKMIAVEYPRNIIIKIKETNRYGLLDVLYTATSDNQGKYHLTMISYDLNEAIKKLNNTK